MSELTLQKMNSCDLDEVVKLERELFHKEAWSRQNFEQDLSEKYAEYWVLRVEDEEESLADYAGAYFILPDVEISNVAISKAYQGRGWSRKLIDEILSCAGALSAETVFLEVDVQNQPAIGLYEKYGFEKIAIRRDYYGAGRDAFVMKLEL